MQIATIIAEIQSHLRNTVTKTEDQEGRPVGWLEKVIVVKKSSNRKITIAS